MDDATYQQQLDQQEQEMSIHTKLAAIQQKLKAPKNQVNKFGGYKYRSCEDILEAVKPLLKDLTLVISDEIVLVGDRIYVCATAVVSDGEHTVLAQGFAREAEQKKGMDESQITGAASSYARKYALNGLFLIDDTKDADATNDHKDKSPDPLDLDKVLKAMTEAKDKATVTKYYKAAINRANDEQREAIQFAYDNLINNME